MTEPDFTEFVAAHQQALLRLATVLCGDARRGEDVVADVLGRAYEKWARIRRVDQPYAYVRRMVVNEHVSWRRRTRRALPFASLEAFVDEVPDHAEPHAERTALVAQLSRLPARQRATLVLRYFEGLPDAEIAAALGCAESTVRSNVARGLAALRIGLTPPVLIKEQ